MRFRHVLLVALALVFVLALVLFLVSKYVPFILPQDLSSDLLLWGVVITAVATFVAAIKDVVELVEKAASSESRAHAIELATLFVQKRVDAINKRNREIMLKKVEVFWVKGVLESSLHGALLLQLGMEYRPDMVDHPWDMVLQRSDQPGRVLPEGTRMVEVFDELGGSFLILGEPGSGKTTALLELARDLIARANQNDTHPIPVVFGLSSWGESRKNIEDWLVDELNTKYDVPNYVGKGWVKGDEVLLLLDGLDEVREEYRDECVDAINQFCRKHMMNMVVCSRTDDYKALTNRLMLPGAIVQRPLTSKQIDRYLANLGSKLGGVRKAIKTDSILQQLARSPLVLSIIALAYWGMSIDDFRPGTLEERRNHLFMTYVDRMFEHRKIIGKYKSDQIIRRLIWLGKLMKKNAQTAFHIEQLQPSALSSGIARAIYIGGVKLAVWLLVGLSVGFPCGLGLCLVTKSLVYGMIAGVLYGLTSSLGISIAIAGSYQLEYRALLGLIFGCAIALTVWVFISDLPISIILGFSVGVVTVFAYRRIGAGTSASTMSDAILKISTARKRLGWSWRTGGVGFAKRLPLGVVFGLAAGLTAGLVFGWSFGLAVGAMLCLTMAVAGAVSYGMIDVNIEPISRPNEGIWRALQNGLRFGVIGGLWIGCVSGYLGGLLTDPISGLAIGTSFFVAGFAVAGAIAGGFAVMQHCVLRVLLFCYEDVPLKYPEFLNRAVYHILLRKVGGGYIFVHRLLLEHFAAREYKHSSSYVKTNVSCVSSAQ